LCCHGSQKYNHEWVLQQLLEVWTKTFKSSTVAEGDVQEDDVEMTVEGGASSAGAPADEDPFEKQMCLTLICHWNSGPWPHQNGYINLKR
jgi:hypothetical protein